MTPQQLCHVRTALGYSQRQFAPLLGVPTRTLCDWETPRGPRYPGLTELALRAICAQHRIDYKVARDYGIARSTGGCDV